MKVTRITLGDLPICPRGLQALRGVGMSRQESAEAVLGVPRTEGPNMMERK